MRADFANNGAHSRGLPRRILAGIATSRERNERNRVPGLRTTPSRGRRALDGVTDVGGRADGVHADGSDVTYSHIELVRGCRPPA